MAEEKLDTLVRREQIAEAAMALVATQGLRRLSMAALARRVGIVPSAIYRHFKNKEEILTAMLDRIETLLLTNVQRAREEHTDPIECLRSILTRHIRLIREGKAFSIPRMLFSDDVLSGNQSRRERVRQLFTRYVSEINSVVQAGQAAGRIRQEFDPQTITMMLLGIVVPGAIVWHLTEGDFDITRHAQRAWQLFGLAITNT